VKRLSVLGHFLFDGMQGYFSPSTTTSPMAILGRERLHDHFDLNQTKSYARKKVARRHVKKQNAKHDMEKLREKQKQCH
ncbi:MAG: hypothetical protein J2P36_33165, partial [Ktedonobacteraceae bacterium]|nr:hypothetical protein [Ktedonobacteraceae bacterium]